MLGGLGRFVRLAKIAKPRKVSARLLDAADLSRLERKVAPFSSLGSSKVARRREAFQRALYRQDDLQARSGKMIQEWVMGGTSQKPVREAYQRLLDAQGKVSPGTLEASVGELLATRKTRWQRLARKAGIEPPDAFRLHRGVRGVGPVEDVVRALETPGQQSMVLRHHTVASWSTDPDVARSFARGSEPSVIYRADIPLEKTLADKWVDGGAFLTLGADQDEVMVAARNLEIPLGRFEVHFQGRTYTPADRQALVRDWRAMYPRSEL
ncbi:MAG: hypothetical protein VKO21_05010 [Candidatus Sericytochromatia bacterium]|nr:hypothetical protein [Candidatus Sericytochromatia bacterium]